MRPLIQKLPLTENHSFVAKTFRTPHFEVGWHQHIEHELILLEEGSGLSFVGNDVGEFEAGDIYLLGANLPHTFQKRSPELVTSATVVHFRADFWGDEFLQLPECRLINHLLEDSRFGLKIKGQTKQSLMPLIKAMENAADFQRILLLGQCLDILSAGEHIALSTQETGQLTNKDQQCIDRVFQFTIDNFREPVTIAQVADIACRSVPAFCTYFKKSTKKTYIDFLNEVRVGHACWLLVETQKTVLEICFESGYNTIANFHKQFLKMKTIDTLAIQEMFYHPFVTVGQCLRDDYYYRCPQ